MVRRPLHSRRSLSARARVLLGVGAAALMVVSASMPAAAAITMKGAILKTRTITVAPQSSGGGKVSCPTGYRVTAGGAFFPVGTGSATSLSASTPTAKGKAWYVAGYNAESGVPMDLTIVAWCLPVAVVGDVLTVRATASVDGTNASGATVPCPVGYRVVTGGVIWQIPGDPPSPSVAKATRLSGTSPTLTGDGWWGSGRIVSASDARLRITALCRPKASVGRLTTVTQDITDANATSGIYLSCPEGQRVLSVGGYNHHVAGDPSTGGKYDHIRSMTPTTDGKGGYLAATNITEEMAIVLQCRPLT